VKPERFFAASALIEDFEKNEIYEEDFIF